MFNLIYPQMKNYRNAYLVTKPIQYVNVLNLPREDKNQKALMLVDSFYGANLFFEQLQKANSIWDEVYFFSTVVEALKWLAKHKQNYSKFYTFSDFGIKLHYYLYRLNPLLIYIYEEGWSSYVSRMYPRYSISSIIHFLFTLNIHAGQYIGSSLNVKGIYVYNVSLHKYLIPFCNKPIYPFRKNLLEHLTNNLDLAFFSFIPNGNFKNKKILLYLSSWLYNIKFENYLEMYPDYTVIFKPHPHFKRTKEIDSKFDYIVDGNYIAEIILAHLLSEVDQLIIVHECSTSVFHFINNIKFKEINLGSQLSDERQYNLIREAMNNNKLSEQPM